MSLSSFQDLGWEAEIVTVNQISSDIVKDDLLSQSIPENTIIHHVNAFDKKWTSKLGLGSIALRSLWFYRKEVNRLINQKKYDIIYFSTTQFPVCVLGAYWKKRFGIPYVIDMQDPWHSEYYQDKPKAQRPAKYWFSYRLNKLLEPIAMKEVGGLISVSQAYIDDLKKRYPSINEVPEALITFGAFEKDKEIAEKNISVLNSSIVPVDGKINIVYVGRGGYDMHHSVKVLFLALQKGISSKPSLFKRFHLYFIGTSYAAKGKGIKSIQPLAEEIGVNEYVSELTDRIGFYESLSTLQKADILFIPGSDDPKYSASKIYPYIMSQKPILAIFHEKSSAEKILRACSPDATLFTFPHNDEHLVLGIHDQLHKWAKGDLRPLVINKEAFKNFSAAVMAEKQTRLFDKVILTPVNSSN
ncbi:glycosyltransferase family 4 protein [Flavihumibacter sp. R14]|nr:glycosyltransferase family 4 protein [Flavihumibacter soli]